MEEFKINNDQNNKNNNEENKKAKSKKISCYLIDETPSYLKLIFFLVGLFGLQLVATILSLFLNLIKLNENQLTLWGNFIPYLIIFITFAILFFTKKKNNKNYGLEFLKEFKSWKTYAFGFGCFIITFIIEILFSLVYSKIPGYGANLNQNAIESMIKNNGSYLFVIFLELVIFAPFTEELTYRVGLCGLCSGKRHNYILGIIISSIIFGFIHFNGFNLQAYTLLIKYADTSTLKEIAETLGYTEEVINSLNESLTNQGFNITYIYTLENSSGLLQYLNLLIRNEWLNLPVYIISGSLLSISFCYSGKLSSSFLAHVTNNLYSFVAMII